MHMHMWLLVLGCKCKAAFSSHIRSMQINDNAHIKSLLEGEMWTEMQKYTQAWWRGQPGDVRGQNSHCQRL